MTATRVQLEPSTTWKLRKPAFPAAAPPPRKQVWSDQFARTGWVMENITDPDVLVTHVSRRLCFLHLLRQKPSLSALGWLVFMQNWFYLLRQTGFQKLYGRQRAGLPARGQQLHSVCVICRKKCKWVSFLSPPLVDGRRTKDVPQDRSAWLHPENVFHRVSTPATSPAPHMEEAWMPRWAC